MVPSALQVEAHQVHTESKTWCLKEEEGTENDRTKRSKQKINRKYEKFICETKENLKIRTRLTRFLQYYLKVIVKSTNNILFLSSITTK